MNLAKLSIWARKIHRILVSFVTISGLIMMMTGLVMRNSTEGETFLPFIDPTAARTVHGNTSAIFAVFLGLMILTGLFLYMYPWLIKILRKPPSTPPLH
jgi:hypothetical protein